MAEGADIVIFEECADLVRQYRQEVAKRIVGQTHIIDGIVTAIIAAGHVLLEGVPGLAKTLAVKTFSDISGLDFKRIQFTPDLLPADLIGTLIYEQSTSTFSIRHGPVFTNLVLADEINRAPAKVQSALLEAMAEHQVTIGDNTHKLPEPFFVLATQNPIEQEGTYNLPEAELDRFLLKLIVPYPSPKEEIDIVKKSASGDIASLPVDRVFTTAALEKMREAVSRITCDDKIIEYIVSITGVTRPTHTPSEAEKRTITKSMSARPALSHNRGREDVLAYISYGASPRASMALYQCAKITALFAGRSYVLPEDVKSCAPCVLRHRLVLSYEAAADGLTADDIIAKILAFMPIP